MAPAPTRTHQLVAGELFTQLRTALRGKPCQPYIAPFDVRLPRADEADDQVDTVVQPDVLIYSDADRVDERGGRGAPDWVAEVLSPASAAHDQIRKRDLYERAGVGEYWLIHPLDRLVTVYRLVEGRYSRPDIREMQGTLALGILPEVVVDWSLFFI